MIDAALMAGSFLFALGLSATTSASLLESYLATTPGGLYAVLAVAFFRTLGRSTILENNIVQTTGSAGESISAGIVFTLPAILLLGYDLSVTRVAITALIGGVLGVLLMIPLRRALIVKEHGIVAVDGLAE